MQILVVDDDPTRASSWEEGLNRLRTDLSFEVRTMAPEDFGNAMDGLQERRDVARMGEGGQSAGSSCNPLDDVDVLILDYDLYELGTRGSAKAHERVTGEEVAYLARCYSRCRTIVGLNQFGENSFDLTLRGHPESFADLNLGSKQLHNPGLWGAETSGYHPWTWPNLSAEPDRMLALVEWVADRLDEPIVEALQLLDDSGAPAVSREALRYLGPSDPSEVTFRGFVVDSGNGLDRKDKLWEPEAASRIAAARLTKWLERLVLAGQDFLVDAPHLINRFPSLLPGNQAKAGDWDLVAQAGADAEAIGMAGGVLLEAAYEPGAWLARPAWRWSALSSDRRVEEVSDPWDSPIAERTFCEDIRRFLPREEVRGFSAAVSSPFLTRYVVDQAAAKSKNRPYFDAFSISDVSYEPSVQFAL